MCNYRFRLSLTYPILFRYVIITHLIFDNWHFRLGIVSCVILVANSKIAHANISQSRYCMCVVEDTFSLESLENYDRGDLQCFLECKQTICVFNK